MRGAHRDVWCPKAQHLIEAKLFAAERYRSAPDGRALLCAADNAREIQGITASQNLLDARNCAPVTPVSLHISDVSAQRRVWGSQEGAREPYGALAPFCLRRQTAAMPGLPIGSHSRLQRQAAVSAERPTVSRRLKRASPAAAGRWNGGTVHPPAPVRELKAGAPGGACQRLIKVKA